MKMKYFNKNDYTQYSQSQIDFNVSKIMKTQIYKLLYYSLAHIIIYIILLTLVNSSFGKRLWNSMMTFYLERKLERRINGSDELDATVKTERKHVKELNRKNFREYKNYM